VVQVPDDMKTSDPRFGAKAIMCQRSEFKVLRTEHWFKTQGKDIAVQEMDPKYQKELDDFNASLNDGTWEKEWKARAKAKKYFLEQAGRMVKRFWRCQGR
jgi:hypothetical protein